MVILKKGNLFRSNCQTFVCPINCAGAMGSGIAKQFKDRYFGLFEEYKWLCDQKLFKIGTLWIWEDPDAIEERKILCFPTKIHWTKKSEYYYLYLGLEKFVKTYEEKGITSIAFPLLGCGKGGLESKNVIPIMRQFLDPISIIAEIWVPPEDPSNPYI